MKQVSTLFSTLVYTWFLSILPSQTMQAQTQTDKFKSLDSFINVLATKQKFLGTVTLQKNGQTIYYKQVNLNNTPQNVSQRYRIGSISKTYTSLIVMKLFEEGKIDLKSPLFLWYPNIPNADKITVEHLLNHSSGLYNFTNLDSYDSIHTKPITEQQHIQLILSKDPQFEPGTKHEYSNSNYVLLSYIIEKITKGSYEKALETYITKPLKYAHTQLFNKDTNQVARSYEFKQNKWTETDYTDVSIPLGAGNIASTANEVANLFAQLHNRNYLMLSTYDKMVKWSDGYGLGLIKAPFNNKEVVMHTGGIDGYASMAGTIKKDDISFAILSNGTQYSLNQLTIHLLAAYYGTDIPYEVIHDNVEVTVDILNQYVGTYKADEFGLILHIKQENGTLIGQAEGQSAFPFTALSASKFEFAPAGVTIEFVKAEGNHFNMQFKQSGITLQLKHQ